MQNHDVHATNVIIVEDLLYALNLAVALLELHNREDLSPQEPANPTDGKIPFDNNSPHQLDQCGLETLRLIHDRLLSGLPGSDESILRFDQAVDVATPLVAEASRF